MYTNIKSNLYYFLTNCVFCVLIFCQNAQFWRLQMQEYLPIAFTRASVYWSCILFSTKILIQLQVGFLVVCSLSVQSFFLPLPPVLTSGNSSWILGCFRVWRGGGGVCWKIQSWAIHREITPSELNYRPVFSNYNCRARPQPLQPYFDNNFQANSCQLPYSTT